MKKSHLMVLCILLALLSACSNKPTNIATIEGNIKGLGNDTLYLYGKDEMYDRIDTLIVQNDQFKVELPMDTLVTAWLQIGNHNEYPIYISKGDRINITGSVDKPDSLNVQGNPLNEELTLFRHELASPSLHTPRQRTQAAEEYIESHLTSLTSLYVLDHYFVKQPKPDTKRIKRLIEDMTGELKDRNYIQNLLRDIETLEKAVIGKSAPHFQLMNQDGKKITRTDYKDKYLLLYFWASWDEQCRQTHQDLRAIYKKKAYKKKFDILGISLDVDKTQWKEAIKRDTLNWEQVCDFQGWESEPVQQYAIKELPTTILLTPAGKIEAKNLMPQELEEKLKEITTKK